MRRFSKKRQCILDLLQSTDCHPSAEWIYERVKLEHPEMSLATVYRNLKQFEKDGLIRSAETVKEKERFDANMMPHAHAVCRSCGKIVDIFDIPMPDGVNDEAARKTGFSVQYSEIKFSGLCPECMKKE